MTKTELGLLMRRAREAAGISQERMGEMLREAGIRAKQSAVSSWERGINEPGVVTLKTWAALCGWRFALTLAPEANPGDLGELLDDVRELDPGKQAELRRVARAMTLVPPAVCERIARRSCEIVEDYQAR